jgi:4'-phosphopantetheinyl transferase EntD
VVSAEAPASDRQEALDGGLDALVAALFPPGVLAGARRVVERDDDLLPEERLRLTGARPARRFEFAAGRRLARALLAQLGVEGFALIPGADRAPRWPEGVVGAIAHRQGLCAVALARRLATAPPHRGLIGVGIDVVEDADLRQRLWRRVCTARELEELAQTPPERRGRLATLLFSAKESAIKCVAPATGASVFLRDVEVEVGASQRLAATPPERLAERLPGRARLEGAYVRFDRWILTGMALIAGSEAG